MTIAISNDFLVAFSNVQKNQQKQVREFIERFSERPDTSGINYEIIQSAKDKSLYSVRINQAYRAVVFHPSSSELYVLAWVDHHDEAYRWAERKQFVVHPATGALQVLTTDGAASEPEPTAVPAAESRGLFDEVKDKHLLRLGVPEKLLPLVRGIQSDAEFEAAEKSLPQEAYEALYMLASGYSLEEVFQETEKIDEDQPVDTADVLTALKHEDSKRRFYVVEQGKEIAEMLNAPLDLWRIFLHPKQRRLVSMRANGPVRVLGGAGTGKTVVAMHRAEFLASRLDLRSDERVLFTTFTRNLATDIQENLRKLCSVETLSKIEVINLDAWIGNFLRSQGYRSEPLHDDDANEAWEFAMNLAPAELGLPGAFYRSEWEQVVQAQNITTLDQYVRASRIGRGTRLSRQAKARLWSVFQEYRAQLNERGKKEYVDLTRDARELIETKKLALPYRSVVVDEAQDMSPEAFRLIRALVPDGENDIFIVGDAHQRIYRHRASLGNCGINIRGRGRKLKINYRTTDEIRRAAVRLLDGKQIDDLDGGLDNQKGYVSLTHGAAPESRVFQTFSEELAFLQSRLEQLQSDGTPLEAICLVARTHKVLESYLAQFREGGLDVYEVKPDRPEQFQKKGLRLATMHRVKGLEFEHIVIASVNKGLVPLEVALSDSEDLVGRENAETAERCLLYVAMTRARKSVTLTAFGEPSLYLAASPA